MLESEIKREIAQAKELLSSTILKSESQNLYSKSILAVSKKLDVLIVQYMNMKCKGRG